MSSLLPWLVLAGPLALVAVGASSGQAANAAPRKTADHAVLAALAALVVAAPLADWYLGLVGLGSAV